MLAETAAPRIFPAGDFLFDPGLTYLQTGSLGATPRPIRVRSPHSRRSSRDSGRRSSPLVSRGLVRWHRRVALGALVLLPVMILSALRMVAVMFANPQMPPFLPPLLAFIDLPSVAFLIVLVTLALRNALMLPVSGSSGWAALMRWYVARPFLA